MKKRWIPPPKEKVPAHFTAYLLKRIRAKYDQAIAGTGGGTDETTGSSIDS